MSNVISNAQEKLDIHYLNFSYITRWPHAIFHFSRSLFIVVFFIGQLFSCANWFLLFDRLCMEQNVWFTNSPVSPCVFCTFFLALCAWLPLAINKWNVPCQVELMHTPLAILLVWVLSTFFYLTSLIISGLKPCSCPMATWRTTISIVLETFLVFSLFGRLVWFTLNITCVFHFLNISWQILGNIYIL